MGVQSLAEEAELVDHPPPLYERFIAQDYELVDEVDVLFGGLDGEQSKCLEVLRVVDSVGAIHEEP